MASLFTWLQDTSFFSALRNSTYVYPTVLSLHVIALAFFGGAIVVTDLRLLGVGMRGYSISDLIEGLRRLKRLGFAFALICGLLLFGAGSARYSVDPWFWIKIALLGLVAVNYLVFRNNVYSNAAALDRSPQIPAQAKIAATVSLVLWTGVIFAARGPATIKDIMHSMVDPTGDAVFESVQEIADDRGIRTKAPHTDAEWQDVRLHLQILEKVPKLVTADGRMAAHFIDRSRNPQVEDQPEDVQKLLDTDRPSLLRRAKRLREAAELAMKAVDAKDQHALLQAIDGIDKACENCHLHYWYPNDKRAQQAAKEDGTIDQ
jgi:hypothetical protein